MKTFVSRHTFLLLSLITIILFSNTTVRGAGASATTGQSITFSVSVEGTGPFNYQWQKDGVSIPGAVSASFSIGSVGLFDAGSYTAIVSNAAGSILSDVALLYVNLPPVIGGAEGSSGGSAGAVATSLGDPSFEDVSVGTNSYWAFFYVPLTSAWRFTGYAGVTGNNSGFTVGNPNAVDGSQVGFIQANGTISQDINMSGGTYVISAQVANRANWGGKQSVFVYVDTNLVGTFTNGTAYSKQTTKAFSVSGGIHTIAFVGTAPDDSTLFLDAVSLDAPPSIIGNGSFEQPGVGSWRYSAYSANIAVVPGVQDWTFSGGAGVAGDGSGYTSSNPSAPAGTQVAFLQSNSSKISQSISVPTSGTYTLTVSAAQRGNWNVGAQSANVYFDATLVGTITPSGSTYTTFTFPISASAGTHTIKFRTTIAADSTLLLDQILLVGP